jgi:hypothetical protein
MNANPQIYKIAPPNGFTTILGTSPYTLNNRQGLAVDSSGAVYIADTGNARLLKAVGGNATIISTGSIALSLPVGVTVDGLGDVFIADAATNQIVEIPASGTPSVLLTGNEALTAPVGISFDSKDDAYIMDAGNNRVVTLDDSAVNFGTAAMGGAGVTIPLTFTIKPGTQVGGTSITSAGIASADFSISSTICTYGTTAAESCARDQESGRQHARQFALHRNLHWPNPCIYSRQLLHRCRHIRRVRTTSYWRLPPRGLRLASAAG